MLYLPPQNPASKLIGYEIYRGDSTGAQEALAIDVVEDLDFDGTIFDTDSTIEVDVNYFYTVKLLNMYGLSAASNEATSFGSPTGDVPDAVTDLAATGGAGKVTLDWSSPTYQGTANLLYYNVQRNDTDGTWDTLDSLLVAKVGNAQFVDESGIPGVEYDYRVLAANEYGDGFTPSNVASGAATGGTSAPSAPLNLEVQSGTGYIVLNWDAPSSSGTPAFTAYSIFRSTSSGSFGTEALASVGAGTLTYNDTSAVAGTPYFYVVKAIGSGGDSPASNQVTATASGSTGTAPSAPQSLSAGGHDGYVILTWQAPSSAGSSAITRYDVFRGTTAGSIGTTAIGNVAAGVLTYNDTTVSNDQAYFYVVKAVNAVGSSVASNTAQATPSAVGTPPGTPTGLNAEGNAGSISLSWTEPVGGNVDKYLLYRGTTAGGEDIYTFGNCDRGNIIH